MDVDLKAELKKVDKNVVKSFLMFDLLVLPTFVKLFYALGTAVILLIGIYYPFWHAEGFKVTAQGIQSGFDFGRFVVGILISVVLTTLWLLGLRILTEAMICLFELHGQLVPKRPHYAPPPAPESTKVEPAPAPPAPPAPPSTPSAPPPA